MTICHSRPVLAAIREQERVNITYDDVRKGLSTNRPGARPQPTHIHPFTPSKADPWFSVPQEKFPFQLDRVCLIIV